jgi:anti-sigma B factor antagonist
MELGFDARGEHTAVVSTSGRLDLLAATAMKRRLETLLAEGWTQLVVDLAEVPFIDSSGLGALIGALKAARIGGGDLRIARPNEQVRYVLEVSTLDRVFALYATVEEALDGWLQPQRGEV